MKISLSIIVSFLTCSSVIAEATECPTCRPKKTGDLVHRNSDATGGYVGHAGIAAGNLVSAFVPGRDKDNRALVMTPWEAYVVDESLFWGAKRHRNYPAGATGNANEGMILDLKNAIMAMMKQKTQYDADHMNQKGKWNGDGAWESDCVGWTEHLYEAILKIDFTPNSFEEGLGWPLTVREQRDSENAIDVPPG